MTTSYKEWTIMTIQSKCQRLWVYVHGITIKDVGDYQAGYFTISLMQCILIFNMTLETTALVIHGSNTFFYVIPPFLMALQIL